jgi:hypothetical protein
VPNPFIHEKFTKDRTAARRFAAEYFERFPKDRYQTEVDSQSCGWDRCDRSVRRADNLISFALRLVDCGAWSKADFVVWHHIASNRRMDGKSDHGSLRLGTSPSLPDP